MARDYTYKPMERIIYTNFIKGVNLSLPDYNLDTIELSDISNLDLLPYTQLTVRKPFKEINLITNDGSIDTGCVGGIHRYVDSRGRKQILWYSNGSLYELRVAPIYGGHTTLYAKNGFITTKYDVYSGNVDFWEDMPND